MKNSLKAALAALVILSASAAHAELNYDYVEAGVGLWSPSGWSPIGPDVRGSLKLNENVFLYGGARFLKDNAKYTNFHIGAAYRFIINQQTDVWAGANLEHQKIDAGCWGGTCRADDNSVAFRGGVRHQLNNDVELGATARLITGDFDYFGLNGHARFKLSETLSFKGEIDVQDGDLGAFAGLTIFFN